MRIDLRVVALIIGALLFLPACGALQEAQQAGATAITGASQFQQTAEVLAPTLQAQGESLRQTAEALAPTLEAQAPGLRQTAEVLLPTLQAQAPELRQTLEALAPTLEAQAPGLRQTIETLATQRPIDPGTLRETVESLGGAIGAAPDDIPLVEPRDELLMSPARIVYTTPQAYGAVLEVYQGDMPANGWQPLPDSFLSADFSRMHYTKAERTATVTVSKSTENTKVEIVIE